MEALRSRRTPRSLPSKAALPFLNGNTHTHTRTRTRAHKHTYTLTHTRTLTHINTLTHTRTLTHINTLSFLLIIFGANRFYCSTYKDDDNGTQRYDKLIV